jgi:DUF2934 family protein
MAETVKKRVAFKTAAKKKSGPQLVTRGKKAAGPRLAQPAMVPHEEIEKLAHAFWVERGYQHGQAEMDWFRAEQALRGA